MFFRLIAMPRVRLYLSRLLAEPVMAAIRERFELLNVPGEDVAPKERLREGFRSAEAALVTLTEYIDEELLSTAASLKVIANCAVGYNNIDVQAARRRGIAVTNTPDVLTDATADLTWALILGVARRLVEGDALARSGFWPGWSPTQLLGADVSGRVLGIVGMGRIGQAVARRASGFGMRVLYCTRRALTDPDPGWIRLSLPELLGESDFVSLHVPLTPETHYLIGPEQLRLMKPSAFLINTARGPIVDEDALLIALHERRIAGAGLDVYEREPTVPEALRKLPTVLLLPHLGSATLATRVRMGMMCLQNIQAVFDGQRPPNQVN
jgi:glyoxylate reductase